MARRVITLDEKIEKAQADVFSAKAKYDAALDELEKLVKRHPYEGVRYFTASLGCSLFIMSSEMRFFGIVKKLGQWLPHALSDGNRQRRPDIWARIKAILAIKR